MDSDRHFRTSGNLFICFTSCFSSMKISSKSILSPGRAREPSQISLSTSLSRRLKSSGSLKNGQASPMFPTGNKKRGCAAFENPEPSSPKVTCIGQVRVKTKKQGKKIRARSLKRRSSGNGNKSEASFRKSEMNLVRQSSCNGGGSGFAQDRNQRWVHLPFTICEALRAFGAELNCFLPCNSSCVKEKSPERSSESGCGTVFARWLVAVENDGRGREIELVNDEDRTEKEDERLRRHVFEGLEFEENDELVKDSAEESRIGICIPPKNALLLMRCRSDPVKMAELAKRFCESDPVAKVEEEHEEEHESKVDSPLTVTVIKEEEEEIETEVIVNLNNEEEMNVESVSDCNSNSEEENEEANVILQEEEEIIEMATENEIVELELDITVENHQSEEEQAEKDEEQAEKDEEQAEEEDRIHQDNQLENFVEGTMAIPIPILTHYETEIVQDAEKLESNEEDESKQLQENEQEDEDQKKELEENENGDIPTSTTSPIETELVSEEVITEDDFNLEEEEEVKETTEKATGEEEDQSTERETLPAPAPEQERERQTETKTKPESSMLPDCLLLMMYEPKLSMEVSKETWVCSTDFIRCVPAREKKAPPPQPPKKPEKKPAPVLKPGRWSCSFPAAAAAAAMIEQKLVRAKGGGYEPFALTRCKSEPMRSSAKLAPDACFWKDRKLEPHRPATFGVGAAGIGF